MASKTIENTADLDDTQPLKLASIMDTLNRLTIQRERAYLAHVASIDAALRTVRRELSQLAKAEPVCHVCGASNAPSGCVNEKCRRYNQCGF